MTPVASLPTRMVTQTTSPTVAATITAKALARKLLTTLKMVYGAVAVGNLFTFGVPSMFIAVDTGQDVSSELVAAGIAPAASNAAGIITGLVIMVVFFAPILVLDARSY